MNEMYGRVMAGPPAAVSCAPAPAAPQVLERDALFLATDPIVYRYLYLLRYIRENDRVLDVEAEYGTGMYYGSESVRYQTGTVHDLQERRSCRLGEEDWKQISQPLEYGGVLATALEEDSIGGKPAEAYFRQLGFMTEKQLYQAGGSPELCEQSQENAVTVLYLRKTDEGNTL